LKQEFEIPEGLADASKVKLKQQGKQKDGRIKEEEKAYHKVQILDPATGTGTFLAEVVRNIYQHFKDQQGMWNAYAAEHLIPRINGFEILMASYAMAHLKLDMLLQKTGYKSTTNERLRIFLTNSLEEANAKTEIPFAKWLSDEANEANDIKQDVPVMVVLGNPPYSGESQNKSKWIERLISDYKKESSGIKLQERNSKWINDDYVKFIRYGQYFVEKNGEGILAYINNHSFLDNPTFRGMRWKLLQAFDRIYILDLHGNAKKKETAPDGSKDENVFDIMQGVSINIFVKTGQTVGAHLPARVFHYDLYGKRADKYDFLLNNTLASVLWNELSVNAPYYFFVPKNDDNKAEYKEGFSVQELFPINSVGIVTARDNFTIHFSKQSAMDIINKFLTLDNETARSYFELGEDVRDWSVSGARKDLMSNFDFNKIIKINYRTFDTRYTYYTGNTKGFHCMPRGKFMQHFLKGENVGLVINKPAQGGADIYTDIFITKNIIDQSIFSAMKRSAFICPLYLYPKTGKLFGDKKRKPNLNPTIVEVIAQRLDLSLTDEKESDENTFAPIDLLDYIYAVLHSPTYRERYKEFLKIDFPRVPYPQDAAQFHALATLGAKLRRLHLLENVEPMQSVATYPKEGSNVVEKLSFQNGKMWINDTQYFDNIPSIAYEFYIGGYQPAQKWLKDRKGRVLNYDDIVHYQRIITVLLGTMAVMGEIDERNK
jgi:predicted helicase